MIETLETGISSPRLPTLAEIEHRTEELLAQPSTPARHATSAADPNSPPNAALPTPGTTLPAEGTPAHPTVHIRPVRTLWPCRRSCAHPGPAHRVRTRGHSPAVARRLWHVDRPRPSLHGRPHPPRSEPLRRARRRIQQSPQGNQLEPHSPPLQRSGSRLDRKSCDQRASHHPRSHGPHGPPVRRPASAGTRRGTRRRAPHHGPQPLPAITPAAQRLGWRDPAPARP